METYIDIKAGDGYVEQGVKGGTNGEGAEAAYRLAPRLVRNMGMIVTAGLPRNEFNLPIGPTAVSARGMTIVGACVGTEGQMEELLEMAMQGKVVSGVEVCNIEYTADMFERLKSRR